MELTASSFYNREKLNCLHLIKWQMVVTCSLFCAVHVSSISRRNRLFNHYEAKVNMLYQTKQAAPGWFSDKKQRESRGFSPTLSVLP